MVFTPTKVLFEPFTVALLAFMLLPDPVTLLPPAGCLGAVPLVLFLLSVLLALAALAGGLDRSYCLVLLGCMLARGWLGDAYGNRIVYSYVGAKSKI